MATSVKYIIIILLALFIVICARSRNAVEHFYVADSGIAGQGLFASESCKKNQRLFKALDLDHTIRTEVLKVNHCNHPNTYLVKEADGWWVYAKKDLAPGEELSIDYWDTPDFIRKPDPTWTC